MRHLWFVPGCALLLGCGSGAAVGSTVGKTLTPLPEPAPAPAAPSEEPRVPPDIVERSALPYHGKRLADGEPLEPEALFAELARADVVCVGEAHDNPHHHFAQLEVLRQLALRARGGGRELAVGFEMFQRPAQPALDEFREGELDEAGLLEASEWEERWGYDFAFYRPLLETARDRGLGVVALNARSELARSVARQGLVALEPELRSELPELDLQDPEHREAFDEAMKNHPPMKSGPENMYAAQVVWDETMAESAARWLGGHLPARQMVLVAGRQHCASSAIPARIERRVPARVVSVLPVLGDEAAPSSYDYAFVLSPEG